MSEQTKYKRYLGDSVYADFDEYHIILTTENGIPGDPLNIIAIEDEVFHALEKYRKSLIDSFKETKE
jgi:hypothetical protein